MKAAFTLYPAIDLRGGRVVRLKQGDPQREKAYGNDAGGFARRWLAAGARWLHVINLDGALGSGGAQNRSPLQAILQAVQEIEPDAKVQFGGGIRSLEDIQSLLDAGVARVIIGTAALQQPQLVAQAGARFGWQSIAVAIDIAGGELRTHGWQAGDARDPIAFARQMAVYGLQTLVYTDASRDGLPQGLNIPFARHLAAETGLAVIAAGGAASLGDLRLACDAGLAGVVLGRALYEGDIDLKAAISRYQRRENPC